MLRDHYFSILGLFFVMFVVFNASGLLASYFSEDLSLGFRVCIPLLFILLYCGIQLTLFKYLIHVIDHDLDRESIFNTLPTPTEMLYFFIALIAIFVSCVLLAGITIAILTPLVILLIRTFGMPKEMAFNLGNGFGLLLSLAMLIRMSFYPFFILDKKEKPFRSIRLSFALTKGNFMKLLVFLFLYSIWSLLSLYFSYLGFVKIVTVLSFVNSFFVVPFTSVLVAVAYRKMTLHYKGDDDPGIMENII